MGTLVPPERLGHILEFAFVNPRRRGRPYKYMYGRCMVGARPQIFCDAVCRINVTDGSVATWSEASLVPAGSPTFVPRPGAAEDDETDGVLLVDCLGDDGRAFVAVLDGRSFAEVARVTLPYRHCVSIHSTWVGVGTPA